MGPKIIASNVAVALESKSCLTKELLDEGLGFNHMVLGREVKL